MGPQRGHTRMDGRHGIPCPFPKSSDHYPNIISSYCILSQVDKACSPVLACICFKGPAYTARLSASLLLAVVAGSRPQHISTSTSNANRPSPGSRRRRRPSHPLDVLFSPHLLPCCLDSGRPYSIAKHSIYAPHADTSSPWPTTINHSTPARDTTRHAIPYHAMPCLP